MSTTWVRAVAVVALLTGGAAACAEDEVAVPTAEVLAERLLTAETYEGTWSVSLPDDAPETAESGVVPEEFQDQLARIELCHEASAEAQAAVQDLRWMAFRQLELEVDDPIRPPEDTAGHMVFVQEFLTSGEPDEIETTFELLRDGMHACLGEIPAGEEGPGVAEEMQLPEVGDDRYGALATVEEQGGWAEWRLHSALVRDGAILMSLVVTDIRADDDPYYTDEQIGEMVEAAVDLL